MLQESNFLIVEDEFLIAETISEILQNVGCKYIRMVSSVEDAKREIGIHKPDMVLTDINLEKEKTGIDLGGWLYTVCRIPFIYITSHTSSEILGKAKYTYPNAYIIKPFKKEDLLVAIELALFNSGQPLVQEERTHNLLVKEGRAMLQLDCNHITHFEAEGNYTTIYLQQGKRRVIRISLSEIQEQVPVKHFVRIHKSYMVNKNHVTEINPQYLIIGSLELPIGRTYQQEVMAFFK